jgi:TolB-like protein/class 3 adenylate cyclase/Tfp pilus assembly protein PilF
LGTEAKAEPQLAHVLFMDIVGSSKLPSDEQLRIVHRLQELVRQSPEFLLSAASDQVISLPTGDGMALAFFNKLDAAVLCATEVSKAIQNESLCQIRMGVHTGPVFVLKDLNGKRNISGAGINLAERVMSCGGPGHILFSDTAAESLRHLSAWRSQIREVGECRVKDGRIRVWNLVDGPIGNPALPKRSKRRIRRRRLLLLAGVGALTLALVAAVGAAFWLGRSGNLFQNQASIAVLPFDDQSPEKNQEYFSDGLAEELQNGLAEIPGLRVAGRRSSFQFKGKTEDSRVIGQKLNVANILEGSVRKQGNRARIAVVLVKAADGFDLWSQTFNRDMSDIFAVQEEIARAVSGELKLKLLGTKAEAPSARTTNAEAYDAYLQGVYFRGRSNKENLEKAIFYLQEAIKLDPRYATAWVELGLAHKGQADASYVPVDEGYRKARQAVDRALLLDPDLGSAHSALGAIKTDHDWDWSGADASFRKALVLAPGSVSAIAGAGWLALVSGRFDEAIARYEQVIKIDPLTSPGYLNLGMALHYVGQQEKAVAAFRKALELAPEKEILHSLIGRSYLAQSRGPEALAEMEQEKNPVFRLTGLALAYRALGKGKESDASLAELIRKFPKDAPYQIAEVYAFRKEPDRAFEWLERAYVERDSGLSEMKGDPLVKTLDRDPRFAAFLKKMGLPR